MLHEVFELQFNFTRQSKIRNVTKRKYLTTFCTRQFHENNFKFFQLWHKICKNLISKFILLTFVVTCLGVGHWHVISRNFSPISREKILRLENQFHMSQL